jgi:hypothetical protein
MPSKVPSNTTCTKLIHGAENNKYWAVVNGKNLDFGGRDCDKDEIRAGETEGITLII